ncbi:hypothetical protein A1O3_08798 [Capronia epimyces CBS 606.96]|uniref:Uncharacterized protein n=1 Tax=Capronia epimyces CBS 606.96 TaxID=1182542 RepID=W9XQN9_9EURO|nr:uncharacterized protein A1O3_08798 [Capronia epimyces CBS 606.96]EXJ79296.1 hypothetical protein A1O3_08798 [Capronia epimyces CBS 606.96]
MEHVLTQPDTTTVVEKYLRKCKDMGFDMVELFLGFLVIPSRRLAPPRRQSVQRGVELHQNWVSSSAQGVTRPGKIWKPWGPGTSDPRPQQGD